MTVRLKDQIYFLKEENVKLLKQRNLFCSIAKRLYTNITQLYMNSEISTKMHKSLLPFLELKLDNIDEMCYECEAIVGSQDALNVTYQYGLDKVDEFLSSEKMKKMVSETLTKEERHDIKIESKCQSDNFVKSLDSSADFVSVKEWEEDSVADEEERDSLSESSEISELEDLDCSSFIQKSIELESDVSLHVHKTQNNASCNSDVKVDVIVDCNPSFSKVFTDEFGNISDKFLGCNDGVNCVHSKLSSDSSEMLKTVCSENSSETSVPKCVTIDKGKKHVVCDSSESSSSSDSSDSSKVKAILFPKINNVPNQLFVKSGVSKGECSRLNSIVMSDNSDVSDHVSFDKNGVNKSDNWCSQFKYLNGNITKDRKAKSIERSRQGKIRDRYRKNLKNRRMQ